MGKLVWVALIVIVALGGYMFMRSNTVTAPTGSLNQAAEKPTGSVKEFTTTAYFDETGVWYSLKVIRVKTVDTVRIRATTTKGGHDFTLDEFGVKTELPLNQEVVIEFKADKTGTFTYYCSKPGHRAKGQFGTLIVE